MIEKVKISHVSQEKNKRLVMSELNFVPLGSFSPSPGPTDPEYVLCLADTNENFQAWSELAKIK